ncbi:hypothetical protein [Terrabacter sp. NPDC080008]|uniref:hypothetical protein n=1 Tax=Terrabacter sp. NPDC080008 TaxID=3155176 RepID=UPI00344CE8EF
MVVFPWRESGYCVEQFIVTATETSTQVAVNPVRARTISQDEGCSGVGSDGVTAGDYLRLEEPLGNRTVVRAQGGRRFEVRAR